MPENCDPNALAAAAKCFKCLPGETLQQIQSYLLCQILNNGGGGGSPVFGPQSANLVFAGPAAGPAAAPAFRALVTDDLGTTMTPQFLRVGIGTPADAAMALVCLIPGAPGDQEVAQFNSSLGDPFVSFGPAAVGGYVGYRTLGNVLRIGVDITSANPVTISSSGVLIAPSNIISNGGDIIAGGIFSAAGNNGTSATYDLTNTVTTTGGIVTSSTQPTRAANLVYAGPAAAGPSVPTFRALVAADIPSLSTVYVPVGRTITIAGTANQVVSSAGAQDLSANRTWTLSLPQNIHTAATPQFSRMGLGLAADATMALTCLIVGGAGDREIARFNCTTGDPFITLGTNSVGAFIQYQVGGNNWRLGVHSSAFVTTISAAGLLTVSGGLVASAGNIDATTGIYICQGNNGITQTFDTGLGNTQIQFVGGIAVAIA